MVTNKCLLPNSAHPLEVTRIGEARNPGPGNNNEEENPSFSIISANATALRPRWREVCNWNSSIKTIQETRLGEKA